MKIRIGGSFGEPEQIIETTSLAVLSEEDQTRAMFEIRVGKDGISMEVAAGGMFKADGVVYEGRFVVQPNASNCVTLRATKYSD